MSKWNTICIADDLIPGVGVCALHQGQQVAIFRLADGEQLFALSNFDPVGEANVMSRGLIGSSGDEAYVASPLFKQRYKLDTGRCLDDDTLSLKTYSVRIEQDLVQLLNESNAVGVNSGGNA